MGAEPNKFQYILDVRGVETDVLANAPENWLDTNITFKRSQVYQGLFRSLTTPTKYVLKGSKILRREFYNNGILANVKTTIKLLNPNSWTYRDIYKGKLDFSKAQDGLTDFTVNSIADDFTVKLNANDGTDYSIPIDVDEAINIELTPLALKETATLLIGPNTDTRSDCFRELTIVNNTQNSINSSVQQIGFFADSNPDFSTSNYWFYKALTPCNVTVSGSLAGVFINNLGDRNIRYKISFYNQNGAILKTVYDQTVDLNAAVNITWNFVVPVNTGDRIFFYVQNVTNDNTNIGLSIKSGQIDLSYKTITPASMCKAVSAYYIFGQLLKAMNTNTDSAPNAFVPFSSLLLYQEELKDLYFTCSDSIRSAEGSLYYNGDTLFRGTYKVVSGVINYAGGTYNEGDTFAYNETALQFTGTGVAQKLTSFLIGNVFNPGDSLQPGGTYLAGGDAGTYITYNGVQHQVGTFFKYVLGADTFTASSDSNFVEQTAVSPQIITNFKDFFQSIYSIQGGNAAFGIDSGVCFIETLDYVYRGTIGNLDCGIVDKAIKIEPATDLQCNSIKVGYKDQQYGPINGYSEVNSEQTYSTVVLQPQKVLNLICPYRADPFGIEQVRVTQTDTAASRSDNDIFMVWKKKLPEANYPFPYYHPLRTETLQSITGVDPSYYNWKLSPKHNLLRGGSYLASIFYKMQGYEITLSAAPKNIGMVTIDLDGNRVAEADPVAISSLPDPLFIPIYVTIKPGLPVDALNMIDSVPYGFSRFTYNGNTYKGFVQSVSVDIGQNETQELKFLLTTGNDLTTLVH